MYNTNNISETDKKYVMNSYNRRNVAFQKGEGIFLFDKDNKKYCDLLGGIAVNALGHSHPLLVAGLKEQIENLIHTSNLYLIENQALLAEKICRFTCADKVFFSNSGAEANEGAIKLAKMYHYKKGNPKYEFITLKNSFHGRTLATLAATGQEKYQKPFAPLPERFIHVEMNHFAALEQSVSEHTAGIILELIQGESGVNPLDIEYVKSVRKLCDEKDIVLIIDEIQTGMGRTGKLMAYEHFAIEPDIFTLAKALGGGVPIGAVCAREKFAAFSFGDHGSTFGGNHLAAKAGRLVFEIYEKENLIENSRLMGEYLKFSLEKTKGKYPLIHKIKGLGLMIGIELSKPVAPAIGEKLFKNGYLVGTVGDHVVRLLPPLIINKDCIDAFILVLEKLLIEKDDVK